MKIPAFTDDAYWTEIIEQYIQNNNKHLGWYNIEYYMWEYFKDCLKSYRLHAVSFTYKDTRYTFTGWWGLNWGEDGEDKWIDFHSKKDFRK